MSTIDAADLLADRYDQLDSESCRAIANGTADEWDQRPDVAGLAISVREAVEATGTLRGQLLEQADSMGRPGSLGLLRGLDDAFQHILYASWERRLPAGLTRYAVRWRDTGILNTTESGGALLPRWCGPGRENDDTTTRPADFLTAVVRIPATDWERCSHRRIDSANDISSDLSRELRVACAPFLETLEEVDLQHIDEGLHRRGYRMQARDCEALRARIPALLARLDDCGADIAILPEAALSQDLLQAWQEAFRTHRRPRRSRLRWLLLGTFLASSGGPRPASRAVLVSRRNGEVLAEQDKQFPFTIDPRHISEWGLPLPCDHSWDESIAVGTSLTVIESRALRGAIAICEDLGRPDTALAVRQAGVTLLIAPIFAKEIERRCWQEFYGEAQMLESGAHVVVANSLAVARRIGELAETTGDGLGVLTSLLVPSTSQLGRWTPVREGRSTNGVSVQLFELFGSEAEPPLAT
jgi:predicted amidohydrolase